MIFLKCFRSPLLSVYAHQLDLPPTHDGSILVNIYRAFTMCPDYAPGTDIIRSDIESLPEQRDPKLIEGLPLGEQNKWTRRQGRLGGFSGSRSRSSAAERLRPRSLILRRSLVWPYQSLSPVPWRCLRDLGQAEESVIRMDFSSFLLSHRNWRIFILWAIACVLSKMTYFFSLSKMKVEL